MAFGFLNVPRGGSPIEKIFLNFASFFRLPKLMKGYVDIAR